MKIKEFKKLQKGFTLIELLIVIAILAALAVIVVFAINPVQSLARTRDTGRLNTVTQLGHALESYATNNNNVYVPEAGCGGTPTWINCLTASGDLSVVPAQIVNGIATPQGGAYAACGDVAGTVLTQNGWCYDATAAAGTQPVVVYTRLESLANTSKCAAATEAAWAVYSSAAGKAGIVCTTNAATEPLPGVTTFR